jgi:hypothetical protein
MGADLVKTVKRTSNNPTKDSDLGSLGLSVNEQWKANPQLTLLWITQPQHEANVTNYNDTLNVRKSTGGSRKEITGKLTDFDFKMDEAVSGIKIGLTYKYGKKDASLYYPQFGIEHIGKLFILPRDRNKRRDTLPLILEAVVKHGFANEKYGTDFWETTAESYNALMDQASKVDGTVSKKVGSKNELRKTIVKTHNALLNLLRANYPDTYKSVMREWGFQKEKY